MKMQVKCALIESPAQQTAEKGVRCRHARGAPYALCLFSALALLSSGTGAQEDVIEILQPSQVQTALSAATSSATESQPYIDRTGPVSFSTDVFMSQDPGTGSRQPVDDNFRGRPLSVGFFADKQVEIQVASQARPADDTLSIQGEIAGAQMRTFTLTITPESYLMTYQDLDDGRLYRVVGDTNTGEGRVTEIDLYKMPPVFDSPPILPPSSD